MAWPFGRKGPRREKSRARRGPTLEVLSATSRSASVRVGEAAERCAVARGDEPVVARERLNQLTGET